MKKYILISLIVVLSFSTAQAQNERYDFKIGVHGGLNLASASGDFYKDFKSRFGFYGGIVAEMPINILYGEHFALQGEVNYSSQGFKIEENNNNLPQVEYQLDYIQVPILFKAYFIDEFNLYVGPQFGYKFNETLDIKPVSTDPGNTDEEVPLNLNETNDIEIGAVVGAEYVFDSGFLIQGRYNFGFSKTLDDTGIHNAVYQFGVGFMF
jgi:hypothetical protein